MKIRLILPAILAMIAFQLVPQAAWSHCGWHGGNGYGYSYGSYGVAPWQARRIWRAEHSGWGYNSYAPVYPGYGYHRGGLLSGFARAIF